MKKVEMWYCLKKGKEMDFLPNNVSEKRKK